MEQFILLMALLFAAYLFLPKTWFNKFAFKAGQEAVESQVDGNHLLVPEDSVLRRHYITQLRSEIEMQLSPRPTDSVLQRHYDALIAAELNNRLSSFPA